MMNVFFKTGFFLAAYFIFTGYLPAFSQERKIEWAGVDVFQNLSYVPGDNFRQQLDLAVPEDLEKKPPLIVWVHGGGWKGGKKSLLRLRWALKEGYAIAAINYRLSGEAQFPSQIHDCKAAIRWLRANAEKYGYDGSRIAVAGSSAGGHLVALLGTSGGVKELEGELGEHLDVSSDVQAVCDLWGPTDLLKMGGWHNDANSPESLLIGGDINENEEAVAKANPITYVDAKDPPFLLLHGDQDKTVIINQSELLDAALKKAKVYSEFIPLVGAGHGARELKPQVIDSHIREFLEKHL